MSIRWAVFLACVLAALGTHAALAQQNIPAAPSSAIEQEWIPRAEVQAGAIEALVENLSQSAKSLKSLSSTSGSPFAPSGISLPPAEASLKLNSERQPIVPVSVEDRSEAAPLTAIGSRISEPVLLSEPKSEGERLKTLHPESITMKAMHLAITAVLSVAIAGPAAADPAEDIKALTKRAEAAEKELAESKTNAAFLRQLQGEVETLRSRNRQLEDEVKQLRQASQSSTSRRDQTDQTPKMGRIKLSNEFNEEMSVDVNGASYRLLPGQSRTIFVPAGRFTYQVLQLQRSPQERYIEPDEEKPIRIYTVRQ